MRNAVNFDEVSTDGDVFVWGDNSDKQLGLGVAADSAQGGRGARGWVGSLRPSGPAAGRY